MKIASLTIWMVFLGAGYANQTGGPSVAVGGDIQNPGEYRLLSTPESLADLLNRVGIKVSKDDYSRYQDGKPVADVRIHLYRAGKDRVAKERSFSIDPKSNDLWNIQIQADDFVAISRAPFGGISFSAVLKLKKPELGKHVGAGQPTTAPESKLGGNEKPKHESKVAPR